MVQRGGGVEDLTYRQLSADMLVVELHVNVCESMGANVVNSLAENTSPIVHAILGQGTPGIRILSNLCTDRMTMVTFTLPVAKMGWKGVSGKEVA